MNIWQRRNGSQNTTTKISRGSIKQIQKYIHLVNQSRRCIRRHHVGGGVSSPTMGRPWELAGLRVEFVREHPLPPSLSPSFPLLSSSSPPAPTSRRPASTGAPTPTPHSPSPLRARGARRASAGRRLRVAVAGRGSGLCQLKISRKELRRRRRRRRRRRGPTPNIAGRERDRSGAVAVGPPELGCVVRRQTAKRRTKDRLKRGRESAVGRK